MRTLVCLAPLLALAIASVSQDPPPAQEQKPAPTVEVSVLEVRATSAAAISTRRLSYSFGFEIVRVIDDADGVTASGWSAREGKLDYRCFQGFDEQSDKDAAERLIELLDAKPRDRDPTNGVERPYELGDPGVLRLTILGRSTALQDLWILERPDGRRATIAVGR
jgi:hypothetical protein